MPLLRIRHRVQDYDAWRATFDADPLDRKGSGVARYHVMRSADLPNDVMIDLEFETVAAARAMLARLKELWTGPRAPTLGGIDVVIVETVDDVELSPPS